MRWDPGISHLRVARVVSAIDVGRIVNPLTARNQVEGAIVMGIGMALFEGTEYDTRSGLPANNNYAEYVVPVHADQPEIDVILLDYPDFELNEFGVRGHRRDRRDRTCGGRRERDVSRNRQARARTADHARQADGSVGGSQNLIGKTRGCVCCYQGEQPGGIKRLRCAHCR